MKRFDRNGNPIKDDANGHHDYSAHNHAFQQDSTTEQDQADFNHAHGDAQTQHVYGEDVTLPLERVNGFELARRAMVKEMAVRNYPVAGAAIAGVGYALEAFLGLQKPDEGRHYASR